MEGIRLWFKNYNALKSFYVVSLTFPFHSWDCYLYYMLNKRLYANF